MTSTKISIILIKMTEENSLIFSCPSCDKKFKIDKSKIPDKGAKITCSGCDTSFGVKKPEPEEEKVPCNVCGLPTPVHQDTGKPICESCYELQQERAARFEVDVGEGPSGEITDSGMDLRGKHSGDVNFEDLDSSENLSDAYSAISSPTKDLLTENSPPVIKHDPSDLGATPAEQTSDGPAPEPSAPKPAPVEPPRPAPPQHAAPPQKPAAPVAKEKPPVPKASAEPDPFKPDTKPAGEVPKPPAKSAAPEPNPFSAKDKPSASKPVPVDPPKPAKEPPASKASAEPDPFKPDDKPAAKEAPVVPSTPEVTKKETLTAHDPTPQMGTPRPEGIPDMPTSKPGFDNKATPPVGVERPKVEDKTARKASTPSAEAMKPKTLPSPRTSNKVSLLVLSIVLLALVVFFFLHIFGVIKIGATNPGGKESKVAILDCMYTVNTRSMNINEFDPHHSGSDFSKGTLLKVEDFDRS